MFFIPLGFIFIYNMIKIIAQVLAFNSDTWIESV